MLLITLLFVGGQNGLDAMCQAAGCQSGNCSPSRTSYFNTPESITQMRLHATGLARNLRHNTDMLMPAITSGDTTHRVAAAFAAGMAYKPDETLFMLLEDTDPLVSQAAREALTYIAVVQLNRRVDFGPYPNSNPAHKSDSANLWRIFYAKNRLPNSPSSPNEGADDDYESVRRRMAPKSNNKSGVVEVKAIVNRPKSNSQTESSKPPVRTRQVTVETIDDSIPGFKVKRINTITVPDETN